MAFQERNLVWVTALDIKNGPKRFHQRKNPPVIGSKTKSATALPKPDLECHWNLWKFEVRNITAERILP